MNKSTFAIYDMWKIDEVSSLRYYYFTIAAERRRRWVIKSSNAIAKNTIVSEDEAVKIIKGRPATMVFRYWDRTLQKAVKIEQQSTNVALLMDKTKIDMSESFRSIIKRVIQ